MGRCCAAARILKVHTEIEHFFGGSMVQMELMAEHDTCLLLVLSEGPLSSAFAKEEGGDECDNIHDKTGLVACDIKMLGVSNTPLTWRGVNKSATT